MRSPYVSVAGLFFLLLTPAHAQAPAQGVDHETAGQRAEHAGQVEEAFREYVAAVQALPDPPPADAD
jgi:hypothetical protein